MKLLFIALFVLIAAARSEDFRFQGYAPPETWGIWYSSGHGIAGRDNITMSAHPEGHTVIVCELNCCGRSIKFYESTSCEWTCIGTPQVRCYGIPLGSNVDFVQSS